MADYAVSIPDLTKHRFVAQWIIAPVVPNRITVECAKGRVDETGLLLECDEERAAAIVAVIRAKLKRHELRCYKREVKGWKRV